MSFPRRLPTPLSQRIASASGSLYNRQGREFEVAIGGVPFRLATYADMPQSIETIKVRKDQFDTEDPGEQSLTGWWRRSQATFHEGAGNLYQESSTSNTPGNGFYISEGVDVFTQGRLTLLKKMVQGSGSAAAYSRIRSGPTYSAVGDGHLHTAPSASSAFSALHSPAKTIVDGLVTGDTFYDVASDGTLYEGDVSSPGTATSWPLGSAASRVAWGKYRLWVIGGRNIWQPDLTLAGGSAQDPIFTNPNPGWTYTCMAEGPGAMYFGGHDGFSSSIQGITLDGSLTSAPYLSGATVSASLPSGELVQEIAVLAGEFIGIGTNRGFRVGVINADGSITYGPLLVEPDGVTACSAITAVGRFFVVAFATDSGNAKAYRIDTSVQLTEGVFAYASDIDCGFVGSITSLTPNGSLLAATGSDGLIWYQSNTEYVDSGYVQSGRIRFRTTEPKTFRFVGLGIEPLEGNIAVSLIASNGSPTPLGSITVQGSVFRDFFRYDGDPMEFASVKIELSPTGDNTAAPVVNSFLVRALPAVQPQRLITLPLLCFDQEQSRSGQRYGATDYAKDRLTAMLTLEDSGEILNFQDFVGAYGNHLVVIESTKFVNTSPPKGPYSAGGILLVELRTVDS